MNEIHDFERDMHSKQQNVLSLLIITIHVQSTRVYVYICYHFFPGPEIKYFTKTLIPKKRIFVDIINRYFRLFQGD